MRQHRESHEALKKERIALFQEAGKHTFKESKRTMKAWDRVRRVLQDLPRWIEHLEVPSGSGEKNGEEGRLCLDHAKRLRTMLFDAETQSETFQETARSTLSMLEKWDQLAVSKSKEVEREQDREQAREQERDQDKRRSTSAHGAGSANKLQGSGSDGVIVLEVGEAERVAAQREESMTEEPQDKEEEEEEKGAPRLSVSRTYQRRMKKPLATVEEEE
jgi:hypothetical protein